MVTIGPAERNKILANGFLPFWKVCFGFSVPLHWLSGVRQSQLSSCHLNLMDEAVDLTGTETCFGEKGGGGINAGLRLWVFSFLNKLPGLGPFNSAILCFSARLGSPSSG